MTSLIFGILFLFISIAFIYAFIKSNSFKKEPLTSKRIAIIFLVLFFGIPNYFSIRSTYKAVFTEEGFEINILAKNILDRYDVSPKNGQIDLKNSDSTDIYNTINEGIYKEDHGSSYIRFARIGLFKAADNDSNGIVTITEIEKLLTSFDSNHDGKVNGEISLANSLSGKSHDNELSIVSKTYPEQSKSLRK